jgi:hypothetical protein
MKRFLTILIVLSFLHRAEAQDQTEQFLKGKFHEWQQEQIANGIYWANDSCHMEWFRTHEEEDLALGFPDAKDFRYSYGDINSDGRTDQLVMYNPVQCDGGNAMMWAQETVLFISRVDKDEPGENISWQTFTGTLPFLRADDAFYHIESIDDNRVRAVRYAFSEDDPHCCPSVEIPVMFDYRTGELVYIGKNRSESARPEVLPDHYDLGIVISDPGSVLTSGDGGFSSLQPLRETENKIEIRLMRYEALSRKKTMIVLAFNGAWSAWEYTIDPQTKAEIVRAIGENADLPALFGLLVENRVFALPDADQLETSTLTYRTDSEDLVGTGFGPVIDGTGYRLEFKIANQLRAYTFSNPEIWAVSCPFVPEFEHYAAIAALLEALILYE